MFICLVLFRETWIYDFMTYKCILTATKMLKKPLFTISLILMAIKIVHHAKQFNCMHFGGKGGGCNIEECMFTDIE